MAWVGKHHRESASPCHPSSAYILLKDLQYHFSPLILSFQTISSHGASRLGFYALDISSSISLAIELLELMLPTNFKVIHVLICPEKDFPPLWTSLLTIKLKFIFRVHYTFLFFQFHIHWNNLSLQFINLNISFSYVISMA